MLKGNKISIVIEEIENNKFNTIDEIPINSYFLVENNLHFKPSEGVIIDLKRFILHFNWRKDKCATIVPENNVNVHITYSI